MADEKHTRVVIYLNKNDKRDMNLLKKLQDKAKEDERSLSMTAKRFLREGVELK